MKNRKTPLFLGILLALMLSACGSTSGGEAIPTIVLGAPSEATTTSPSVPAASASVRGGIVASGIVVPAQEAHLAFLSGGNVTTVNVVVGSKVKAGDVLVELDSTLAQLDLEHAQRTLREMTSPAAIAAAEEVAALALEARDDRYHDVLALNYGRASVDMIDEVQAEITRAEKRLEAAEAGSKRVANKSLDNSGRANALLALNDAKTYLNSLHANYEWYISPPSETDVAKTTAQAAIAEAAYQEAEWHLAALKGEDFPVNASGAMLTQLQQAQADLVAAQKRLEQTRLVAPFSGVVAQVNLAVGDFVSPSQVLVIVSGLENIQVKTTDLSERDILRVQIGASAEIAIDALGESFRATVVSISPVADTLGGDVVYEVTLDFEEKPAGILGGMTAEVAIDEVTK